MKKYFIFIVIIIIFSKTSFAIIDTLRHYNPAAASYAYEVKTNNIYFARFDLPAPGFIKQIIIKLGGISDNGTLRLSFYGHEAGTSFPQLIDTLIPSFTIHKTQSGTESVIVNLPQTLWYDNNQFFIGISKASTNVKVICDNAAAADNSCASSNGGTYYYMFYYQSGQPYLGPKKAFAIDVIMDHPTLTTSDYFKQVNTSSGIGTVYSSGSGAWSDYNNDGYIDLLTYNKLFKNSASGTFTDVTISSGLTGNSTRGVIFADMNNDGNMDIITLGEGGSGGNLSYVYINDGNEHFSRDTLPTIPNLSAVSSASIGDPNNDKYPDLFIGQIWDTWPVPLPNFFMINNKNNGFIDSTTQIYPGHNGTYNWPNAPWDPANYVYERNRNSRGSEWVDFNNDGKMDLYVTNYFLQLDEMYKNNGNGTFTDVITSTIIDKNIDGLSNHGTGVDWGDYDNDGNMDLLLPQFAHPFYAIQYYHRGTTIYKNNGVAPDYCSYTDTRGNTGHLSYGAQGIQFEETHGGGAWGDYDNDGLLDFAITAFYGCRYVDVYHHKPDHSFEIKTFELGSINNLNTDDEVAWVDYDNDGKLDLCVGIWNYLYHNEFPSHNNWVEFDLVSSSSNYFGIGGRVTVYTGGQKFIREVTAGRGELAQNPPRLHFGIGTATQIDSILVRWPNGTTNTEKFCVTSVNNIYKLIENSGGIASPLITASGSTNFCQGNSVTLFTQNNTNVNYQWKLNGINIPNANLPYINVNQGGVYSLEISNGTSCTANSDTISVVVTSPVISAGANIIIQPGTDTVLNASASGGSGYYIYNWSPSDSLINANVQNPQTVNLYTSNLFNLTVIDSITGCQSTDNVAVIVSTGNLSASCYSTPLTACKDSIQLFVVPLGGSGNYTYTWDHDSLLNNPNIYNPIAIIGTSTTFSVTVSDGINQVIQQITVTPCNLPSASITNTGNNTFCQGGNTQLISNSVSGINYQWLRNGIEIHGDTNQYCYVSQSGIYQVKISDSLGCSKVSDTLNITVLPAPTAKIIQTGVASICEGETYTFLVDSAIGLSYQWMRNGSIISGQTGTSFSTNLAGLYSVIVSNNICADTSVEVQLYVLSFPVVPFIYLDSNYILHSNYANGNQWYNQYGVISGASSQDYAPTISGSFYDIVTFAGCGSDTSNTINVVVGIEETENHKTIKVYPNPVSNELIIEYKGNNNKLNFEIINFIGQVVYKGSLLEKTVVQTTNFSSGVYLIKLNGSKTFGFKKIIKE